MVLLSGLRCSVHFVILTMGRQIASADLLRSMLLLSFNCGHCCLDVFFGLAMPSAAPVFSGDRLDSDSDDHKWGARSCGVEWSHRWQEGSRRGWAIPREIARCLPTRNPNHGCRLIDAEDVVAGIDEMTRKDSAAASNFDNVSLSGGSGRGRLKPLRSSRQT